MELNPRKSVYLPVALGLLLVLAAGLYGGLRLQKYIDGVLQDELRSRLTAQLNTTEQALNLWVEEQLTHVHLWSHERETLAAMLELLKLGDDPTVSRETLLAHPATTVLRDHLRPVVKAQGYIGYVLTHPNGLNVSALLDEPVGEKQMDMDSRFIKRVLKGGTALSLPRTASVKLPDENGTWRLGQPTMFSSTMVHTGSHDGQKNIELKGILSFRIRPEKDFVRILQSGSFGRTGHAFALNDKGVLLSDTRFSNQFKNLGIIKDHSILTLAVKDPGGNLLEGFTPARPRTELPLTEMARQIARHQDGMNLTGYRDYRGVPVVGAWKWLGQYGFGIAVETEAREALFAHRAVHRMTVGLFILLLFLLAAIFLLIILGMRIRRREKRYRAQVETTRDPIIVARFDNGEILYINRQADHLVDGDGGRPQNFYGLFPEEERPYVRQKADECARTGESDLLNQRVRTGTGHPLIADVSMDRILLEGEEYLQATMRDPAERIKLEELQTMAGEVAHLLFSDMGEAELLSKACSIIQNKGKYRFVWIGFRHPENFNEITPVVHCGDYPDFFEELSVGNKGDTLCPADECLRTGRTYVTPDTSAPSDMHRWREAVIKRGFRSAASIPLTVGENQYGCLNIFSGTTGEFSSDELRHLERAAARISQALQLTGQREEKKRLQAELENLARFPGENPHPVMRFSGEGKVIYSNQPGQRILEYWHSGVGEDLPEGWKNLISQAAEENVPLAFEEEVFEQVYLVSCQPVPAGGYVNAYWTNITDRQRAERELARAKEEAEYNTRLKDRFVSLVSHDLKGPLGNINGYLTMLREVEAITRDFDAQAYLTRAEENIKHMKTVIQDILDISRFTIGGHRLKKTLFKPGRKVDEAFTALEDTAKQKSLSLENRIESKLRLYADAGLFAEVMQNLVSNAIKFSNKNGNITVTGESRDGYAVFQVTDNGVGIPEEKQQAIFHYHSKSTTAGTSGEIGTGFGLPLCREIIDSHHGSIEVDSAPGHGTTFTIRLPDAQPTALVVEDDETSRTVFTEYLKSLHYRVIAAEDGQDALEKIRAERPDLIVTDIQMPRMNGLELLEEIKGNNATREIPVVLLTGNHLDELEAERIHLAEDFMSKPVNADDFKLRIKRFLN